MFNQPRVKERKREINPDELVNKDIVPLYTQERESKSKSKKKMIQDCANKGWILLAASSSTANV